MEESFNYFIKVFKRGNGRRGLRCYQCGNKVEYYEDTFMCNICWGEALK